ncbi:K+-transporting ATPase [Pseudomonas syringae pv. cilantro]|uniref:K+-transporting ATPase n=2 Tax=Pseudomonas syringae group TaxID=136849 RepID=A0A0N0X8I5_PSESX|nr:K+-transporting ATPase [Pseudomonas syringae pv. cilantro]KPW79252.1 hypothetical protein ALO76_101790 [Pseudomonas syringae pv. coriandricola]RMN07184.1 hypothetical protein ALQ65_101684 [Pseudomonas syringae pv. coriandricola]
MTALTAVHAPHCLACSVFLQLLYARRPLSISRLYSLAADNHPTRPAP